MKNVKSLYLAAFILTISGIFIPENNSGSSSSENLKKLLVESVVDVWVSFRKVVSTKYLSMKFDKAIKSLKGTLNEEKLDQMVVMGAYYVAFIYYLRKDVKIFYNRLDTLYEQKNGIPSFEYRNFVTQVVLKYGLPLTIFLKLQNYPPEYHDIFALYGPLLIATRFFTPSLYWAFEETTKSVLAMVWNGMKNVTALLQGDEEEINESESPGR